MAEFVAAAAQMVFGAIVDEVVSRGVSMVVGKRKERASQGQYQERLRKAANEVEFVLERTAKMPITELSLLRDRFELKRDFIQAVSLLNVKHKKRQPQQEITQAVTSCSSSSPHGLVTRPAMFSVSAFISMSKDELCLSCDDVERFEQFADSVRNILTRVESGCSLRRWMHFPSPLVRHLFEWKTLIGGTMEAGQDRCFVAWPAPLEEGRGVEALVVYVYLDRKRPEKSFSLVLVLRLSESTDIAGVAINCLQLLTSQFNIVADNAVGELNLLASNLQDVSHSSFPPWVGIQEDHKKFIQIGRPDPLCCKEKGHGSCGNNVVSSELSHAFPEEVIGFYFGCYMSAPEYSLRSSSKRSVERNRRPPLMLSVGVMPHYFKDDLQQASIASERIGDNDVEGIDVSMQQVGETVRSRALNCFLRQPKVTEYWIGWSTRHGTAFFTVEKLRAVALKTSSRSKQS